MYLLFKILYDNGYYFNDIQLKHFMIQINKKDKYKSNLLFTEYGNISKFKIKRKKKNKGKNKRNNNKKSRKRKRRHSLFSWIKNRKNRKNKKNKKG